MTTNKLLNHITFGIPLDPKLTIKKSKQLPKWLPQTKSTLFTCARHSLFHAWKLLNLPLGAKVLIPAFVCNSVTKPLKLAGAKLIYYRVKADLSPDLNHAEELLKKNGGEKIQALLWYHYLGFSFGMDEAKRFCTNHHLYLIEDGAHAIPYGRQNKSEKSPGSWGDVAVFSIRKFLPVINGGALIVNNKNLLPLPNISWRKPDIAYQKAAQVKENFLQGLFEEKNNAHLRKKSIMHHIQYVKKLNSSNKTIRDNSRQLVNEQSIPFRHMAIPVALDSTSLQIIQNVNLGQVATNRRNNYNTYQKEIGGLALYQTLPNDTVPLGFSIIVPDRNEFRLRLAKLGVESGAHWPDWILPEGTRRAFTNEKYLADHLLTLPCHQDLSENDIRYVSQEIKKLWR